MPIQIRNLDVEDEPSEYVDDAYPFEDVTPGMVIDVRLNSIECEKREVLFVYPHPEGGALALRTKEGIVTFGSYMGAVRHPNGDLMMSDDKDVT